jgi:hemoglobin-like flavoprotein
MTPDQIHLVQASWKRVAPVREEAAALFCAKLFRMDPRLKSLCKTDMREQGRQLAGMLGTLVANLARFDGPMPRVQELGRHHVACNIKREQHETMRAALLETLEAALEDDFTAEVRNAWSAAYAMLATAMIDASHE